MKEIKFDRRASKYDEGFEGRLSERFYHSILSAIEVKPDSCVLDVGCGTGTILNRLSRKAPIHGYGLDVSEAMLKEARQKCLQMNFQVGDCARLPFEDETFDIVTACMAYHHFPSQEEFRREALRILKPHGRLYICDPRLPLPIRVAMNGIFKVSHTNACFYTAEELKRDFSDTGFSVVDVAK